MPWKDPREDHIAGNQTIYMRSRLENWREASKVRNAHFFKMDGGFGTRAWGREGDIFYDSTTDSYTYLQYDDPSDILPCLSDGQ
jgi:hypothetical protein